MCTRWTDIIRVLQKGNWRCFMTCPVMRLTSVLINTECTTNYDIRKYKSLYIHYNGMKINKKNPINKLCSNFLTGSVCNIIHVFLLLFLLLFFL